MSTLEYSKLRAQIASSHPGWVKSEFHKSRFHKIRELICMAKDKKMGLYVDFESKLACDL